MTPRTALPRGRPPAHMVVETIAERRAIKQKVYGGTRPLDQCRANFVPNRPVLSTAALALSRAAVIVSPSDGGFCEISEAVRRRRRMASAKRIICVGHAALDRIYRIEAFPPEPTKVRALEHVEA